jgi:hypothetical protein
MKEGDSVNALKKLGGKEAGRLEGQEAGRLEGWEAGRLEGLDAGKLGGWKLEAQTQSAVVGAVLRTSRRSLADARL